MKRKISFDELVKMIESMPIGYALNYSFGPDGIFLETEQKQVEVSE